MWHEARKQERKIRGMMVDYKKRSERRRLYYHRIKADPTQFLRIQGVPSKIYVEEDAAEIESAASALMPWQGNRTNMIDRFDVRANLDIIPEPGNFLISSELGENAVIDQKCQYERWRTLATNDLVGLGEEECLTQIAEDESAVLTKATKKSSSGAKIGFSYDSNVADGSSDSDDSDADSKEFLPTDPDLDITFDVRELDAENKSKLNEIAAESYAIPDFTRLHIEDKVESEMREFEIREEQNRAERVAKLSKTERRKEKEERRKSKDVPPHMRVDDPYRKPHSRRSSSRRVDQSDSSSDEEKTVQNIEISSARSNTYKNVKSAQKPTKISLPTFLQPKTANSGLTSLVAARKQLLSKNDDAFDFGIGPVTPVEQVINASDSKSRHKSRSSSKSPERSRSRRSRSSSSRGRSRSRSRNRAYSRSRSRSRGRSRSRSRGRSRSRSRGRRYSSNSSRHRSRSSTRLDRGLSPRRKVSPAKDISAKPPSPETVSKANELPLKKSDSLKALKPHERLKLKLQNQLKKRQRDEKKKEQALIEAKEQEAYERAEELRVLKRQMWEKEEEEYWKKREEEEREYQKKKAEEKAQKADESSSNGEKNHSRSRSGSRRRQKSRSDSRDKSSEGRNSKRARSSSTSHSDSTKKISLVPEYEGVDGESSRNNSRRREDAKSKSRADEGRRRSEHEEKQRSDENRRRSRNEGDRRRGEPERRYPSDSRHGDPDRSRYQGDTERGDRSRHPDCGRRRDDDRGRHHEESRGRDRDRGSYRSGYR